MSTTWDQYLALLDESAKLIEAEEHGNAEAKQRYEKEARRIQNELSTSEREFDGLRTRNSRLQVGVRDLTRSLGMTTPVTDDDPGYDIRQLSDAMRSAEYDLDQLRKDVEYTKTQASRLTPPPLPASSPPPPPAPAVAPTSSPWKFTPILVGAVSVAVLLVIVIVVAVM